MLSRIEKIKGRSQRLVFTLITVLLACSFVIAESDRPGKITGHLVDSETGEALIGVTVMLEGTSMGAATDLEGRYTIANVPDGSYSLRVNYIGYTSTTVQNVIVKKSEVTTIDLALSSEAYKSEDVVVEARAVQNTDAALLKNRQKSTTISDAISAEALSRSGSGDAADAVTQVPGATVQGGKYVIIRGLGGRYSSAQLNGAELPSADPDQRSFQLDLLPSNLLDNIVVSKSFTPDKPGNFSGGVIDIGTKEFPETFLMKVSSSSSYNSQANMNDAFLTYGGGELDWLGFDDGTRDIPDELGGDIDIPSIGEAYTDPEAAYELDRLSNVFNTTMAPVKKSRPLNHNLSVSIGDKTELFGRSFGYLASFNYNRDFSFYDNGEVGLYHLAGHYDSTQTLTKVFSLSDAHGSDNAQWGALFNGMYKLSLNNEIGFNFMRTQSGHSEARYLSGKYYDGSFPTNAIYETRVLKYAERSLNSAQLKGMHNLAGLGNIRMDWVGTYNINTQDEPDLRFFTNHYTVEDDDTLYTIRPSLYAMPQRFFRTLDEDNLSFDLKFSMPFRQYSGMASKFSFGGYYSASSRTYRERVFEIKNQDPNTYTGNPEEFFSDNNTGIIDSTGIYTFGNYLYDGSELRGNYDGDQDIYATFAMVDMPLANKLRFIGGVRYEVTDMETKTHDPSYDPGILDNKDMLPSASFVYSLTDNINIRAAYGRTLARPSFREMAPFPTFDFANGYYLIGNPNLKRTLIDNLDLRYEWFARPGEILAVGVFTKKFYEPIERVIKNVNGEIQFQNVNNANVYGMEFEIRRCLDIIHPALANFHLDGNFSLIKSRVKIAEDEWVIIYAVNPNADDTRPLQGQSPYIVNLDLTYNEYELGTMVNLSFNVFGERISAVSEGGTPNVYEQPAPKLNLVMSQVIMQSVKLKFSVKNIFDSKVSHLQHFKDNDYIQQEYKNGRTISFGISYDI